MSLGSIVQRVRVVERLFSGYEGRMFLTISLGAALMRVGRRLLPPLIPLITAELTLTPLQAGVVLGALRVGYAVTQYPGGHLSDQLSRKTSLLFGIGILLVGTVVAATASQFLVLAIGSGLIGAGEGFYGPADRALLTDLFQNRLGSAMGVHMIALELAGIAAAGLAALAISRISWRITFLLVTLSLGVLLGILVVVSREQVVFDRVTIPVRETGSRLLQNSGFRRLIVAYSLFSFTAAGAVGFLPTLLLVEHDVSATIANLLFGLIFAIGIGARPLGGWLSDRFPRRKVGAAGLFCGTAGILLLIGGPSILVLALGVVLFATGNKMFSPAMQAHLMDIFPEDSRGGDLGGVRTIYLAFGSLGPMMAGAVASVANYLVAFAVLAAAFLVGGVVLLYPERTPDAK